MQYNLIPWLAKRIVPWRMTGFGMALSLALVSAAFGQETGPAIPTSSRLEKVGIGTAPIPMPALSALAKADEAKDGWWISETIAQSRKDQPVFFGVRLANAPQAALAETYKQFFTAGETLAVRLWGCNDLPREFKGRVQVALKQGDQQFAREDKTVRLAPETAKRLAKYSFDTEDLAAGQYALETSLFNNAGELVQQQVTTVIIRVTEKQSAAKAKARAKAEEKAKKEAELKGKADLSSRSALAKAEAEQKAAEAKADREAADKKAWEEAKAKKAAEKKVAADLSRRGALAKGEAKAEAQAAEKAKREAELKAKADLEQKAADEAKVKKAELKAKQAAEKQAAADLSRRSALAKAEAEKQAAEADLAKKAAEQKLFEDTKSKYMAQEKSAIAVKAAALTRQETEGQSKIALAEADQQVVETQAAALVLEAKTAQAKVAAQETAETRAKQVAKQDAPKDVKAQRAVEAKAAEEAREQASVAAKAKARQADAAKRIAEDKAELVSDAKAALVKQRKRMAEQSADLEAQAVKNAERQAKEEIKANQIAAKAKQDAELKAQADLSRRSALAKAEADKKAAADLKAKQAEEAKIAREAKVKARIEARSAVTVTGQPATEAQADLSRRSALAKGEAGKPVAVTSKDLEKEKWRVAVGMLYRQIGAQRFKAGSYSASYVGKKSSHDHWVGPAGGLNDAGNRIYDDGYVGSDDYSDLDSGTWNWGYDNGRQVKGNTIEFTGTDEIERYYSRQTTITEAESSDNADYRGGLMLAVDRYLAQTRFVDYGVSFGLSRAQTFQASANGMNNFNDYQEWSTDNFRVLDTYDIAGLGITPDSVPYKGNAKDEGPVIDTSPMTRQWLGNEQASAGSYRAFNSISESLDMDLSTLSLGMSLKGNYRRVYVVGSTGPTLNMLEKDATYEETLFESNNGGSPQVAKYWNDSSSGTEYLFGYYVQAEVGVRIYHELHLGIFGRYDWLENVSGNVGPSRYEVNPSGGSMGGTIGLHF